MVQSLLIFNSSFVGSRDLWWVDSPDAIKGYNVYRSHDAPNPAPNQFSPYGPPSQLELGQVHWELLNKTGPIQGHFYRDMTTLETVSYTVGPNEFVEQQQFGRFGIHLRGIPYSEVVTGRPMVAISPDDVTVTIDGVPHRPAEVQGMDQAVWLKMDNTIIPGGPDVALADVSNGIVWKADYTGTVGSPPKLHVFQVTYQKLVNYVDVYTSLTRAWYTVVPVGDKGECHKPGAQNTQVVNTQQIENLTWEWAEAVRRNQWVFEMEGEPARILLRKSRGEICGCRGSDTGNQQPRTACPICYETGWIGGYIGPYDIVFVPPDTALIRELNEGGVKATRTSRSYLTVTPIVQSGDIVVRRNGERLVIGNVTTKSTRGIILQQEFDVELRPLKDTIYLIPVDQQLPVVYNPVVQNNPVQGIGNGEGVVDPRQTTPDKPLENPNLGIGRTPTWAKIQN
jgi:hypothetical protein